MQIDRHTSNPSKAPTKTLIAILKDMGSDIKFKRRRFIACLPEINRRRLWPHFGYDTLTKMACCVADFSVDTVRRVISMEKKIRPFVGIKRLFEQTNIGWSKFELAARVIDEKTASDLHKLLKNNASYSAIKTYVKDIEREREEVQKAKEAAAAAKESENAHDEKSNTTSGLEPTDGETKEECSGSGPAHMTSEKVIQGASCKGTDGSPEGQATLFSAFSKNATNGKQPAIGQLVMQGGVEVVTLTLYPQVAERLMQKVDQLGEDYSRVKGVSKIVEHLLNSCPEDLVLDKKASFHKTKKVKTNHTTDVVFWDKTRDAYFARTRFGTVSVPNEKINKDGAYDNIIRMDDLYVKAKEKAAEYALRVKSGEKVSRKLPAAVETFLFYDSGGGFCQYPGCNKRASSSHHGLAYAIEPNCDPDTTYKPCDSHHELKHSGLKRYDDDIGNEAEKAARKKVDSDYRLSRKKAMQKKAG